MKLFQQLRFSFVLGLMVSGFAVAQSNQSATQPLMKSNAAYQPQPIRTPLLKNQNPTNLKLIAQGPQFSQNISLNGTQPMVLLADVDDRLSRLYDNVVINYTELDKYALKFKLQNPALYEAGRNTIFSQVENPFSANGQF